MLFSLAPLILVLPSALGAPVSSPASDLATAATVGKIRGVRDPIYHLYLQANSKNGMSLRSVLSPAISFLSPTLFFRLTHH
jgi:hypothetical protein